MKTHQSSPELPHQARPTRVESVTFHDGMLVSAEDLQTAANYPVSLFQTVLRAQFGCGVVCGLGMRVKRTIEGEPPWVLCVDRGLAVDCQGYPVELVVPVELDLSPDPCASEPPETVLIALRRITSDGTSRYACSCSAEDAHRDCSRVRDLALVRAFTQDQLDALPGSVCRHEPVEVQKPKGGTPGRGGELGEAADAPAWCRTLTACSSCSCDGAWILLGSVALDKDRGLGEPDTEERRWVKPVAALCAAEQRIKALEDRVAELAKALTGRPTGPS